jgi:hypothetical protein
MVDGMMLLANVSVAEAILNLSTLLFEKGV